MSEHTPGPWTLLGTDATMHREIESSDGVLIMAETEYGSETPTNHGDWVLIARAPEMADTIAALTARVEELEWALKRMIDLCTLGANPGAFDNGNLDSTGTIDEGDFIAGRIIDEARAAITQETRNE